MKHLLFVHAESSSGASLASVLASRRDALHATVVDSLDAARREWTSHRWDAVLVGEGFKSLGRASFLRLVGDEAVVMVLGEPAEGVTVLAPGTAERIVDQVFAVLHITRSATFDLQVVEDLGLSGAVNFERVEWPEASGALVRAQVQRGDFSEVELARAQRAGQLHGPGLAPVLETVWEDPRPHVLHPVPAGVSLWRLMKQRRRWDVELALGLGAGLCDAISTLHAAEFSVGSLRAPSVWLTREGDVLSLGQGLTQLPYTRSQYYGLPSEAPPEEYGLKLAPQIPGDAFRLGVLVLQLIVETNPLNQLQPLDYLRRSWRADLSEHAAVLGPARKTFELLLGAEPSDRPRGALLREVVAAAAPSDARRRIQEAVAWSVSAPASPW